MKTLWKIPWIHFWDFCWGWYLIYFSYGYVLAVNTSEDGFTKSYWETHSLHFTRIKMEVSQICRQGTIHTAVHDHCHNHPKHSQRHLGSAEALSPSPQHTMETLLFSCIVVGCTHCNRPHVLGKRWKVLGLWERKGMWFCLSNISWPHHFPKNDLHNKKRPQIHESMGLGTTKFLGALHLWLGKSNPAEVKLTSRIPLWEPRPEWLVWSLC